MPEGHYDERQHKFIEKISMESPPIFIYGKSQKKKKKPFDFVKIVLLKIRLVRESNYTAKIGNLISLHS